MLIIYRISDSPHNKIKPNYINNENCLKNMLFHFPENTFNWLIIADNTSPETDEMIRKYYLGKLQKVNVGHGAGTFNVALDVALRSDQLYVYFAENDFLHRQFSSEVLLNAFELGSDYVTLYDHPDKYIPASRGDNPFISEDGSELTRVYLGRNCHYKMCYSTTMTFAAKIGILKKDEKVFRKLTSGTHPFDFKIFTKLTKRRKRKMLCPIPGYSTHGETEYLSPFVKWENEVV
jgi:hypothetical protein